MKTYTATWILTLALLTATVLYIHSVYTHLWLNDGHDRRTALYQEWHPTTEAQR